MITQKGKINEVARALQKVQELFDSEAIDLACAAINSLDRWIPISEAPRDGRKLLMYNAEYGGQQFVDWVAFDGTLGKYVDVHKVTHFQYLPEPPTQEVKAEVHENGGIMQGDISTNLLIDTIKRAVIDFDYKFPCPASGIIFYDGQRITQEQFNQIAKGMK